MTTKSVEVGDLLNAIRDQADSPHSFVTCWSLSAPDLGLTANRFGDRVVPAASTRKVAVMLAVLAAAERGELSLDEELVLDERYRHQVHSGVLQHVAPGLTMSLLDAVTLMIIVSDNLCTAHVLDRIGLEAVNALCAAAGMANTRHLHAIIPALARDHDVTESNYTTAGDQARLLELVLRGSHDGDSAAVLGLTSHSCQTALDILTAQQHYTMLPSLLPEEAMVAHKIGVGWRDVSDVGIISGGSCPPYVLAVYVDDLPPSMPDGTPSLPFAEAHIARLSRSIWEALAGQGPSTPDDGASS